MTALKRHVIHLLIFCMLGAGVPLPASAGIVATDEVAAGAGHDRIRSFLDRSDVRAQLEALGVDSGAARARVDALTDDEARNLAARIDELPAGGTDFLGAVVFIFVLLLVTDLLGLTKVFPFTRPVR